MFKIRHFFEQSWLLIVSSFLFGLLIAVTNAALAPRIEQNRINKLNSRAKKMLPAAAQFVTVDEDIEVKSGTRTDKVDIYRARSASGDCVGWTFNATGSGFADKIELVVAVDAGFAKLAGFDVLSSNETVGFGDKIAYPFFRKRLEGKPAGRLTAVRTGAAKSDSDVETISGATISSEAVVSIISNSVTQIKEQMLKKGLIGDGESK